MGWEVGGLMKKSNAARLPLWMRASLRRYDRDVTCKLSSHRRSQLLVALKWDLANTCTLNTTRDGSSQILAAPVNFIVE